MDIEKEREALIAEIEVFKAEMLKSYVIKAWADSYVNTDPFSYAIFEDENNKIWWMKAQTHEFWRIWQAAKAIPEGFVVVPRKSIEHWYLDEGECLWMDEPDNWLCDMDVGDVQEVEHKEYIVTESNTLYATKVWDGENQNVSSWEFFNSKDDAEKAAEYCKAMIEAQEQAND